MNYHEALGFLYPRTTTIKFGLDTTRVLLESLGNPESVYPTIHVGGTNGKGSVSTLIAAALREAGWKVGLYTSPHLCSFRERITVDGVPVSEQAVAMWTAKLEPLIKARGATFFEATTAMALADFAARGVEIAVLEVGLGGRLDSTNVVTPLVSGVTNVALDHQKYLGDTIEEIAREKAGIAKPDVPFVIGESDPAVADLLAREAHDRIRQADSSGTCDIVVLEPDLVFHGPLGLAGPHQRRNAAVARTILDLLPERYRPSEEHVAAGFAGALAHAIVSILGDKPWPEMLVALDQAIDVGILTLAPTAADRGWDTAWLSNWLARPDRPPQRAEWHLVPDFREALDRAQRGAGTVLVTGSFHTVGDVMQELGLAPVAEY